MNIPASFTKVQQEVFQDKRVEHFLPVLSTGSLGTKTSAPAAEPTAEYYVNIRKVTDALKAQEWGLTVNRDAVMTVSKSLEVNEGDYIRHNNRMYRVVSCITRDAYRLFTLKAV